MKIVLIEDQPECFENYKACLQSHQHIVQIYSEADDVIKKINDIITCDLIILDLMIQLGTIIDPAEALETGIAIYIRIRALSQKVKILILTARTKADVWESFQNDLNVRYLAKPIINWDTLYRAVENWD